jgi:hypothetical protein
MIGYFGALSNVNSISVIGFAGANDVLGATVVTSSGGGGGGTNNWRFFPEANTIRFFPNDILRGFPMT